MPVDLERRVARARRRAQALGAGDRRARVGPDQRQQPALERALVQLHVVADLEAADHVEQRLQRDALGVEQQLARRRVGARRRRRGCAGRRASCPCASGTPRSGLRRRAGRRARWSPGR